MTGAPPKPLDCQKPLLGAPVIGFSDLLGHVMNEARILERLGQSHEHILDKDRCENPRAEVGVPEVASWPSIAALFVAADSIYKQLGCDCYDKQRNALTYAGNSPVVAHPPCQLWGKFAKVNYKRWGGEHNKPGNDGGCFRFALDTVNRCGGVLEHPAETYAWLTHGLPYPGLGWTRWKQGWVCEVWQSAYGHRANKRTWLYCSGSDSPLHPRWERPIGTHQVGFHDQRGKAANKPTLSKREANATPPAFAHYLLELAATCAKWPNSD